MNVLIILVSLSILYIFVPISNAAESGSGPTGFNIAAVGDWACNDNTQITVKNILTKKTELVLAL